MWDPVVPLSEQLSNFGKPLLRLVKGLEAAGGLANLQVEAGAAKAELIAQTGADDPSKVRLEIKENRKLSPAEVAEVATLYEAGASLRLLADKFGMHEQTVRAHLRRQGVALRGGRALSDEQGRLAATRYTKDQQTIAELAAEFGVSRTAMRNGLLRQGVSLRRQARRSA